MAQSPPVEGELAKADIAKAVEDIRGLGDFFARLAQNDPNRYAARLWITLQESYVGAARQLADLLEHGRIRVDSLPEGTPSLVDGGTIVVDRGVAGRWLPRFVRSARRSGDDWQYTSLLSTLLLQDLLRLEPDTGRAWFREHLARSKLAEPFPPNQDPRLTRHLAGFWHIKDKHLWLSMLGDGTADPDLRRLIEGRKIDLLSEIRSAAKALDRDLGSDWAERLWLDWQDYDRQIRRFSPSRSWLMASRRAALENLPPEETVDVPLPKPKPRALRQATPTPTPVEPDVSHEARLAELATALEESRAQARRREAQLLTDLEASPRKLEVFETALAQSGRTVSELRDALVVEREARRKDSEVLRAQLATEQQANRQKMARLEEDMTVELEASQRAVAELREQLTAERVAGQKALAGLQTELTAAREASRKDAAQVEEQLAAEIAASREKIELIRQELTAEMETGRRQAVLREAEVAAALEAGRQETARTVAVLSAELAASRKAAAPLRERIAEFEAGPPDTQRVPEERATDKSGPGVWLPVAVLIVLLGLAGLAAAVAVQRRRHLPKKTTTPQPSRGESAAPPAVGSGPALAKVPPPHREEDMTPQIVVEALRRGDIGLFEVRFAKLAGLRAAQLHRILYGTSGEDLAIVCRALGMDKLLFASVFLLSHKGHPAESKVGPRDLSRVTAFYDRITDESAQQVLQEWQRDPGLPGVIERLRGSAESGEAPGQPGAAE